MKIFHPKDTDGSLPLQSKRDGRTTSRVDRGMATTTKLMLSKTLLVALFYTLHLSYGQRCRSYLIFFYTFVNHCAEGWRSVIVIEGEIQSTLQKAISCKRFVDGIAAHHAPILLSDPSHGIAHCVLEGKQEFQHSSLIRLTRPPPGWTS